METTGKRASINPDLSADPDEETCEIEARVIALLLEFGQVKISDGHHYSIIRYTRGVDMSALKVGMRLHCIVTIRLPRVLFARVLDSEQRNT